MANISSIHSVGNSLITFLRNTYPQTLRDAHPCDFRVLSSGELADETDFGTTLSLYLYRVIINEHLRNRPLSHLSNESRPPLSVDLHFMLSIWTDSAVAEHTICAWVMQQLHHHPIMDRSSLSSDGGWGADDVVHILPSELSNEDLMRIWDTVAPNYRLSVSYIARVIRIDPEDMSVGQPVVATRYQYAQNGSHSGG
ncbi:MAG: DUF4255 domain-containing protein [Proteobacteria bacterium]|nr:DUF4255 domain-containing protein [Pseudomonadota bacterium]MBU4295149.1 DUF4255 domain-containing protein [Pseudomonadota bacterium]MCG2747013.1 DUF4255 domain-containing protein [Desulfobulbaceae bacterium]